MVESGSIYYLFPIVLVLVALIVGVTIWSQGGSAPVPAPAGPVFEVGLGDLAPLGRPEASVAVVEFGDYACSFCASYFQEALAPLQKELAEAGRVRWYWRDFATLDPRSVRAAAAGRCAAEQGRLRDFQAALWPAGPEADYAKIAGGLGLDEGTFLECIGSGRYEEAIEADRREAVSLGVQAAPTFFINGERISGVVPIEILRAAIERHSGQSVNQ